MLLPSSLRRAFGVGALFALVGATGTGCTGCSTGDLVCDSHGENCVVCGPYGCSPADPHGTSTGESASSGKPGSGGAGGETASSSAGGESGTGGAGGAACDQSVTTCPCATPDHCSDGKQCVDGLCIAPCEFTYECGAD